MLRRKKNPPPTPKPKRLWLPDGPSGVPGVHRDREKFTGHGPPGIAGRAAVPVGTGAERGRLHPALRLRARWAPTRPSRYAPPHRHGTAPPHRTAGSSAPAPSGGGGGGVPPSPALSREAGARCRCPPTAPLPAHQPPAAAATAGLRSAPRCARPRPPPPPPGEWQTGPRVGRGAAAAPPLPASRPAPSGHGVGSSPGGGRAGTPPPLPPPTRVSPLHKALPPAAGAHATPSDTPPAPPAQTCTVSGTSPVGTNPLGGMQAPTYPPWGPTHAHPHPLQGRSQRTGTPRPCTPTPGLRTVLDPAGRHWEPESSLIGAEAARQGHGEVQPEGMLWEEKKFTAIESRI